MFIKSKNNNLITFCSSLYKEKFNVNTTFLFKNKVLLYSYGTFTSN